MATVAMSGSDTIIVNDRVLKDLADANVGELTYPNDIANIKTGKNGNSIYALNETGKQSEMTLRIVRGSSDDKFLNNLLTQQYANFASFPLMTSEFIKQIGDGTGKVQNDTYIQSGGIFTRQVDAKSNVEGEVEQSVAIYKLKFSNSSAARVFV